MPLHDYKCVNCEKFETRFVKLDHLCYTQFHYCGGRLDIVYLSPPMMSVDIPAYQSPINGKVINSRRQRKEDLRRNGCVEWEPGFNEEAAKREKQAEIRLDAAVDDTVEEFVTKLPVRKRELLEQEIRSGADLALERST